MSDNKISAGIVNLEIPKSIDNAITNLTDKPTLSIGATLSDIWFLVFGGIGAEAEKRKLKYAHSLQEFKSELESKIEDIPQDRRIEADVRIVAPALEASKYCVGNEEIRAYFINLITASMNKDTYNKVHPSYVDVVKQLTTLEAHILKHLNKNNNNMPMIRIRQIKAEDKFDDGNILFNNYGKSGGKDCRVCEARDGSVKHTMDLQLILVE